MIATDRSINLWPILAAVLATLALTGLVPTSPAVASTHHAKSCGPGTSCLRAEVVRKRPFSSSSIWGSAVDGQQDLSPLSSAYVGRLQASVRDDGAWVNTTQWSTPVYSVGRRQRTVPIQLDGVSDDLQQAMSSVPVPKDATPAADTDSHLVVYQRSTDTMWELWGASHGAAGWQARYGGRMDDVSKSPGYFPSDPGWGATATGLPMLGGLIRLSELRAGLIPHALALEVPEPSSSFYAWPAQRSDGTNVDPRAIPEGTRFRIDPSLDLSTIPMAPYVRTIAEAAQRYGMYVTDKGDSVAFTAEDPTPTGSNPYWPQSNEIFGGEYPSEALQQFPWGALQAVDAPLHRR